MILSPPFIPEPPNPVPAGGEPEEQYLERAMSGGAAGDGGYPVSVDLNWHGGLHLTAPAGPVVQGVPTVASVRAMADGTVAYVRQPTPATTDPTHPLNYRGGWTDDGCVVIRHETEIGVPRNSTAPTTVTYFSIYMHLRSIGTTVVQGQRIYRKDVLGAAGRIYGQNDRIHFEIICDDANVQNLTGRAEARLPTTADGREDAVFGAIWYVLPANTPYYASEPQAGAALPAVAHTTTAESYVRVELRRGNAVVSTFTADGVAVGAEDVDPEYEYNLCVNASHDFPSSPSAGYDLRRFGRVLGPDPLPANTAHWRRVPHGGGTGWVNLNDAPVRKFSDADFPHWEHWVLVDGSASADSRCQDLQIQDLLDANHDWCLPADEVTRSLNDPQLQKTLSGRICKHRTEWDVSTFDAQCGWRLTDPTAPMTAAEFEQLRAHATALAFWPQAALGIDPVHWHFHPRRFIALFRKCGWLSLDELTQLMPRRPLTTPTQMTWATARQRFSTRYLQLNLTMRRYNLLDVKRQTHFLAQTYVETDRWATVREYGIGNNMPYGAFYGRGIMQLTWAGNYKKYGVYRQLAQATTFVDARITATSTHHFEANDVPAVWAGQPHRFDPQIVETDNFAVCDSGGFYWASKRISGRGQGVTAPAAVRLQPAVKRSGNWNINQVADRDFGTASVGRACVLVNGGGNGFDDRQRWAAFIYRYRSDSTETTLQVTLSVTYNGNTYNVQANLTAQRP